MADRGGLPAVATRRAAGAPDPDHELAPLNKNGDDGDEQRFSDDLETADDREDAGLLPQEGRAEQPPPKSNFTSGLTWMVVNTLATIGIVNTTFPPFHTTQSYLSTTNRTRSSPTRQSSRTPPSNSPSSPSPASTSSSPSSPSSSSPALSSPSSSRGASRSWTSSPWPSPCPSTSSCPTSPSPSPP
jgi:hypothetical protein